MHDIIYNDMAKRLQIKHRLVFLAPQMLASKNFPVYS